MQFRIGFGYDTHQFVKGRELRIGGVGIDYPMGLEGHSDADVLIHAICDALLGAANLRDIGQQFPDSSADYKNIDSLLLLKKTGDLLKQRDYYVNNIDSTICAEEPKLATFIPEMKRRIAKSLDVDSEMISIKATTSEKMGFVGRGEGISAYAVALIQKNDKLL